MQQRHEGRRKAGGRLQAAGKLGQHRFDRLAQLAESEDSPRDADWHAATNPRSA